jgi:hypothetical protein
MSTGDGGAPSWLFSFVDLAFLSMIAMTQIVSDVQKPQPDLGELVIPSVGGEVAAELSLAAKEQWQLRVLPPDPESTGPYELIHRSADESGEVAATGEGVRLSIADINQALEQLERDVGTKPLLAPHKDSRSQDLLDAASAIESLWPTQRRALVARNTRAP